MRTCNKCGKEKPLNEFAKGKSYKDGRRKTCKMCVNASRSPRGWRGPTARVPGSVARQIGL